MGSGFNKQLAPTWVDLPPENQEPELCDATHECPVDGLHCASHQECHLRKEN